MATSLLEGARARLVALGAALIVALALVAAVWAAPAEGATFAAGAAAQEEAAAGEITAALTVVDQEGGSVVYNGKVGGLAPGDTVADLLAAAGFEKRAEYAGDPHTYVDTNKSPYFLGKGSVLVDADTYTYKYWVTAFDGTSDNWSDAMLDSPLKEGGHYQYLYTVAGMDAVTFAYGDEIPDPLLAEPSKADELLNNLVKRFSAGGENASLSNFTYNAALALGRLGLGRNVDTAALEANLGGEGSSTYALDDPGRLAKYVRAFAAAGDAERAKTYLEMVDASLPATDNIYSLLMIAPMYAEAGAVPSGKTYSSEGLVKALLDQQAKEGEKAGMFPREYSSVQETAEAMIALASYRADAEVAAALEAARAAAVGRIDPQTGGVVSEWTGQADVDAMGELIEALIAYDGGSSATVEKLAEALVEAADEDLGGYEDLGSYDEVMTASVALRGLAAAKAAGVNPSHLDNPVTASQPVYRLYNSTTGEHLFTTNPAERAVLIDQGWSDENIGWMVPRVSDVKVYRLFNPTTGEHIYTCVESELNTLRGSGAWRGEGIAWYADDAAGAPVRRLICPGAPGVASHFYTASEVELAQIVDTNGGWWHYEGIAFFGRAA